MKTQEATSKQMRSSLAAGAAHVAESGRNSIDRHREGKDIDDLLTLNVSHLYELPVASVTNCHTLSGLQQPKFLILQFWRSENQNESHRDKIKGSAYLCSFQKL